MSLWKKQLRQRKLSRYLQSRAFIPVKILLFDNVCGYGVQDILGVLIRMNLHCQRLIKIETEIRHDGFGIYHVFARDYIDIAAV